MSFLVSRVDRLGCSIWTNTDTDIDEIAQEISKFEKYYPATNERVCLTVVDSEYKKEKIIRVLNVGRNVPYIIDYLAMMFEDKLEMVRNNRTTDVSELIRLFVRTKKWLDSTDAQYHIPIANYSQWIDSLCNWKRESHNNFIMVEIVNEILKNPTKENVADKLNLYRHL